ncbi:tRNA 2-selenouridine(34) synthase MnmH [Deferribacteraceae bacterium V6Fe1]|nr:tRNA 2-selenouridine(34) synthase MnmH [Deferribacteraceae bacterium V6Fe1]
MGVKGQLTIEEILEKGLENFSIIDVRSPGEFREDHIPNAINIPLLDDEERKEIGIIYKNIGPDKAKLRGVEVVSPKLPEFIKAIHQIYQIKKPVVIYCWRGGLRSEASVTFARLAGISVSKLIGGYKSYRKFVSEYFANMDESIKFITLFGPTCSGKTEILECIAQKGFPVINFEKCARHKGSVFGHIGEDDYPYITQKKFESEVFYSMYKNKSNLYFVEGESKKIGKVTIPNSLFKKIKHAYKVYIDADISFRVKFAIETYKPQLYEKDIHGSLQNIKRYLDKKTFDKLTSFLNQKNFEDFTKEIMLTYYDPLYKNGIKENIDYQIKLSNIEDTANELTKLYKEINNFDSVA